MTRRSMQFGIMVVLLLYYSLSVQSQQYLKRVSNNIGIIEFYDSSGKEIMKHSGTGTLIYKSTSPTTGHLFLVTNRHCLPTNKQGRNIYFKLREGDDSTFKTIVLPVIESSGKYSDGIFFGPDSADVVALIFDNVFNTGMFHYLEESFIYSSLLATIDTLKSYQITIGDEVYFMGYPSWFYDKRNVSPVLRSGVIATDPVKDFYFNDDIRRYNFNRFHFWLPKKFQGFLIDANVVGGSSGSLVLVKPNPLPMTMNGKSLPIINKPFILGILSDSYFDIGAPDDGHTRVNLGGVISSEIILRTLNLFH